MKSKESARVTSKGQVTIPRHVRDALSIRAGDEIVFELRPDGARLQVSKAASLGELYGSLPATRPYPGKEAVRQEVARRLAAHEPAEDR